MEWFRYHIQRICSGISPKVPNKSTSLAARLPLEIIEIIFAHLIYHKPSLLACSLTCRSWYIVLLPHIHHTLVTEYSPGCISRKFQWPAPLWRMYKLSLLPLVKRLQICAWSAYGLPRFTPMKLCCFTLLPFLQLTNVQELAIDYLDIRSFMPMIRSYFRNFLPTVRSLTLKEPKGSHHQVVFFIGLFQHLEDLGLLYHRAGPCEERTDDEGPMLVPPFVPPLRGHLILMCFTKVCILEIMIRLFGGVRFRSMHLFYVVGMRLLLDTTAGTLETLRLYPKDPPVSSLRDFDLSRNRSLQTLETMAWAIEENGETTSLGLEYALSTIKSPVFSNVTVIFQGDYYFCIPGPPRYYWLSEFHRKMRMIRGFQLVLHANNVGNQAECGVKELERAVAIENSHGGMNDVHPRPLVTSVPWGSFPRLGERRYVSVYDSGAVSIGTDPPLSMRAHLGF